MFDVSIWMNEVTASIVQFLGASVMHMDRHKLTRTLYYKVHLHGAQDTNNGLKSSASPLKHIGVDKTTFREQEWRVIEQDSDQLLLERNGVSIVAPRSHPSVVYESCGSCVAIIKERLSIAVMPGWDRMVSAYGVPTQSTARIYMPIAFRQNNLQAIVSTLDSSPLRWHIKAMRANEAERPDAVVLYMSYEDLADVVSLLSTISFVDSLPAKIPGFSIRHVTLPSIGIGVMDPASYEKSYGWSFASELSDKIVENRDATKDLRTVVASAVAGVTRDSREGRTDVRLPW